MAHYLHNHILPPAARPLDHEHLYRLVDSGIMFKEDPGFTNPRLNSILWTKGMTYRDYYDS